MWYHYLALLIGLYLFGSSVYNAVVVGVSGGYVISGINIAIGLALIGFGYYGITAPAPVVAPAVAPLLGGLRKLFRR
jgi:hypothetical protein